MRLAVRLNTIDETIKELLSKEREDDFSKASCDVLRALAILGGRAWHSDLNDLSLIHISEPTRPY